MTSSTLLPDVASAGTRRFARAFVRAATRSYWRALCRASGVVVALPRAPGSQATLDGEAHDRAVRLGAGLARQAPRDAMFAVGVTYADLLPERWRTRRGVHFTPPPVVDRLLDLCEAAGADWARVRAIDPSCGGGAFLAGLAVRIRAAAVAAGAGDADVLRSVEERLAGWELDPFSAWLARVSVRAVLLAECARAGRACRPDVRVRDALAVLPEPGRGTFDLVVGNPPFGRVRLSPLLRRAYADSLYGHANLYGLFTHLGVRLAAPGGLLAYVTPTSFLGGQYFTRLRGLLVGQAPPVALDFVRDRTGVFAGVLQETALAVFARGSAPRPLRVGEFSPGPPPRAADLGSCAPPAGGTGPWLLPRSAADGPLIAALGRMPLRLADYGYGVSTGPLVWNRHRPQLRLRRERNAHPVLWANCVLPPGRFDFRAARARRWMFVLVGADQDHLVTRQACVLVQRTTAKEQPRRLVAAVLPAAFLAENGGVVVENHLNVVRPTTARPAVGLDTLAFLLNSPVLDRVFRCISGSVAVSSYEMEALPLPPLDVALTIERMLRAGREAAATDALAAAYARGDV